MSVKLWHNCGEPQFRVVFPQKLCCGYGCGVHFPKIVVEDKIQPSFLLFALLLLGFILSYLFCVFLCYVIFVFCLFVYCHICVLSFCILSHLYLALLYFVTFVFCLLSYFQLPSSVPAQTQASAWS